MCCGLWCGFGCYGVWFAFGVCWCLLVGFVWLLVAGCLPLCCGFVFSLFGVDGLAWFVEVLLFVVLASFGGTVL